jgi:fibronectin-binding autotransporter adhesin
MNATNSSILTNIQLQSNLVATNTVNSSNATSRTLTLGVASQTLDFNGFNFTETLLGNASSANANLTIVSQIINSGNLTIQNNSIASAYQPSNAGNSYVGVTTVKNNQQITIIGSVAGFGQNSYIGQGNGVNEAASFVLDGATLAANNAGATTFARLFTLGTNGATITTGSSAAGAPTFSATGSIQFLSATKAVTFILQGSGATVFGTFSPLLSDPGPGFALTLNKTQTGTWVLTNGGNSYSGNTQVNQGTLKLGANSAAGVGPLRVGSTAAGGIFDMAGFSQTSAGLFSIGVGSTLSQVINSGTSNSTLALNLTTGATQGSYLGVITSTTVANIFVVKNGGGTETFGQIATDTRPYNISGGITVNAGILNFGSSSSITTAAASLTTVVNTPTVTVNGPGVIGGTGTIAGAVNFVASGTSGAHLAPGAGGAGVLKITGAVDLSSTATNLDYELPVAPGGTDDLTQLSSTLKVASDSVVNVLSINATGVYPLITFAPGNLSGGDPTQWTVTGPYPGFAANVLSNAGEIDLNVTNIPEPSTISCLGLAGLGLLAKRRRRRAIAT